SGEDILGAGEEMDDNPQSAEIQHRSSPPQEDKPTSSTAPHTEAFDTDSSSNKILKKISGLERAKTHIKSSMSSLQEDTSSIKSMMTEMYNSFRGQSSSAPSSSVAPTFALTNIPSNVKGENTTHTAAKEPHSHTKGETDANI
nr:hypothetical protein [Tanacetum cinerariifolium]